MPQHFSRQKSRSCSRSAAQGSLYRRLPACTNGDNDAGSVPASRVQRDLALSMAEFGSVVMLPAWFRTMKGGTHAEQENELDPERT